MTKLPTINFHLADCMDFMQGLPDKCYDLAIVDPPYGIGEDGDRSKTRVTNSKRWVNQKVKEYTGIGWDNKPMDKEYFIELKRVSKNQIIWGANHFISRITLDSPCWLVWYKVGQNPNVDFADCELAYTSFRTAVRKFDFAWTGFGAFNAREYRIHPTQKPVALYKWLLTNYAKPGHLILDTHGGSMSSAIACHDLGFDLDIIELDPDYFKAGTERFNRHVERWHKGMSAPIHDPTDYSNLGGIFSPAPNDCPL
jgi:site-specific DNA-methyltransferase (adenine-specific)